MTKQELAILWLEESQQHLEECSAKAKLDERARAFTHFLDMWADEDELDGTYFNLPAP